MDTLERGDRFAELSSGRRVSQALLERAFRDAEGKGSQSDTAPVEGVKELPEAVVHRSQHVLLGDDGVLENELASVRRAPAELVFFLGRRHATTLGE